MKNRAKLYYDQKVSMYELQKSIGLEKNSQTLYRYARCERKIEHMPIRQFLDICYFLKEEPNELYEKIKKYQEDNKKWYMS